MRMRKQECTFGPLDLIRIYYALKSDSENRRKSQYAEQYQGEIRQNRRIMDLIETTDVVTPTT